MKATEDLTIEEWKSLFENEDVFKYENMLIMRRFLDIGGAATCSQLSRRYGDEWTYYNLMCSKLAKRIANKKNIELDHRSDDSEIRWPVLFTGENVSHKDDIDGAFLWILKPNLKTALEQVDLSKYEPLYNDDADLIENIDELRVNINRFEELKAQDGFDIDQLNSINRSSKCFLRYEKNGKICFVNSKIIGYRIHDDVFARRGNYGDGNKTSHCIDDILGKRSSNSLYEEELKQFWSDQNIDEWKDKEHVFWSIDKVKQYFVARITGNQNVFKDALLHNYWRMQERYDHEDKTNAVTNNLNTVLSVHEGDVLLLMNSGRIYAYGIVKASPKETIRVLSLQNVINNKKHEYFDENGIVKFEDCEAYYERNYNGCNSDWSQFIDVEKWISYCPDHPVNKYGVQEAAGLAVNSIFKVGAKWAKQKIKELDEQFEKDKPEEVKMIEEMTKILNLKKNIILQGAPGTGKTYNTAALALSILGESGVDLKDHAAVMKRYNELLIDFDDAGNVKNDGQIGFVTFHQSMDYEDFVEGIKPETKGNKSTIQYSIQAGIFKSICNEAKLSSRPSSFDVAYEKLAEKIPHEDEMEEGALLKPYTLNTAATNATFGITLNSNGNLNLYTGPSLQKQGSLTKERIRLQLLGKNVDPYWKSYYDGVAKELEDKCGYGGDKPKKANGTKYVLIIDEINRGNISKIFGELITLLEADKRELVGDDGSLENGRKQHTIKLTLPYSKDEFSVPSNLYIIGTMNTTDRSVGSIDYAVRRRFAFYTLAARKKALEEYYKKEDTLRSTAIARFEKVWNFLNAKDNRSNDMEFDDLMVGHSYFMAKTLDDLNLKWKYEVIPLLKEYQKDGLLRHSIDIEKDLNVEIQEAEV